MKIAVIGGGIIGLMTARELALAGQSVTLLDRGQVGQESSWAGGGILSPLYPWRYSAAVNRLARWSQAHYPALASALIEEGGLDPEWTRNGLLILDTWEAEQAAAWAVDYGLHLQRVDAGRCQALEPGLARGQPALWLPEIAQIRNPRLVKSVRASCEYHGVQIRESCLVEAIHPASAGLHLKMTTGELQVDAAVVAGGAWSGRILANLGVEVPIKPVRGQMIMYAGQPGQVHHITLVQGHYLIPRRDGRILVGSTLEEVQFDKSTTDVARQELSEFATGLFPTLADTPIERHWSGLRPGSPDGTPYICAVPGIPGLYLNAGHFRNGVVLAPASARLLADQILGREPILDVGDYALNRQFTHETADAF